MRTQAALTLMFIGVYFGQCYQAWILAANAMMSTDCCKSYADSLYMSLSASARCDPTAKCNAESAMNDSRQDWCTARCKSLISAADAMRIHSTF